MSFLCKAVVITLGLMVVGAVTAVVYYACRRRSKYNSIGTYIVAIEVVLV